MDYMRFEPIDEYLSDWFPRQGDSAIFRLQKVFNNGTVTLTTSVLTKNSDDPGPGTVVGSTVAVSNSDDDGDVAEQIYADVLEELVRFKFACTGAGENIIVRMLPNVFYDEAKVPE